MYICCLNRSSKVCLKKSPACHTRTLPSSLPAPNIILIFLYCPTATRFLKPFFSRFEPIYYLLNIVTALPADHCRSPQSKVFYNRPLLIGPAFINSNSVCLVIGTCYCEVVFTLSGDPRGERRS